MAKNERKPSRDCVRPHLSSDHTPIVIPATSPSAFSLHSLFRALAGHVTSYATARALLHPPACPSKKQGGIAETQRPQTHSPGGFPPKLWSSITHLLRGAFGAGWRGWSEDSVAILLQWILTEIKTFKKMTRSNVVWRMQTNRTGLARSARCTQTERAGIRLRLKPNLPDEVP